MALNNPYNSVVDLFGTLSENPVVALIGGLTLVLIVWIESESIKLIVRRGFENLNILGKIFLAGIFMFFSLTKVAARQDATPIGILLIVTLVALWMGFYYIESQWPANPS